MSLVWTKKMDSLKPFEQPRWQKVAKLVVFFFHPQTCRSGELLYTSVCTSYQEHLDSIFVSQPWSWHLHDERQTCVIGLSKASIWESKDDLLVVAKDRKPRRHGTKSGCILVELKIAILFKVKFRCLCCILCCVILLIRCSFIINAKKKYFEN